jgi:hypothetical protein
VNFHKKNDGPKFRETQTDAHLAGPLALVSVLEVVNAVAALGRTLLLQIFDEVVVRHVSSACVQKIPQKQKPNVHEKPTLNAKKNCFRTKHNKIHSRYQDEV